MISQPCFNRNNLSARTIKLMGVQNHSLKSNAASVQYEMLRENLRKLNGDLSNTRESTDIHEMFSNITDGIQNPKEVKRLQQAWGKFSKKFGGSITDVFNSIYDFVDELHRIEKEFSSNG